MNNELKFIYTIIKKDDPDKYIYFFIDKDVAVNCCEILNKKYLDELLSTYTIGYEMPLYEYENTNYEIKELEITHNIINNNF